jgi:hypothetical protein
VPAPVKPKLPVPQEHDARLHRQQERGAKLDLYFMNGADAAESETQARARRLKPGRAGAARKL